MAETNIAVYTVDAFTDEPFRGNPAAVCLLPTDFVLGEDVLQSIAMEMNLSETAYIQQMTADGSFSRDSQFNLRWFTPTNEVPLCGHATLASAATLFQCCNNRSDAITFHTKSGPLIAKKSGRLITLDFPLNPTEPRTKSDYTPLIKEICDPELVTDVEYSSTTKKLVLRLKDNMSRSALESLCPDTRSLQASDVSGHVKGVIVTLKGSSEMRSTSDEPYDFVSRYFAPWNGIPEDPVTGSAHTVLADYWRKHLQKSSFHARQCSRRGGDMLLSIVGDRVELSGSARIVLRGHLML